MHSTNKFRLAADSTNSTTKQLTTSFSYITPLSLRQPLYNRWGFSQSKDMASSPYRDRTLEFRSLTETLKKIGGISAVNQPDNNGLSPSQPSFASSSSYRSEFKKKASRIGLGIHETSQKISRLSQCMPLSLALLSLYTTLVGCWENVQILNKKIEYWKLSLHL